MIRFSERKTRYGFTIKAHIPMEYEININEMNNFISAELSAFMKPELGKFRRIVFTGLATRSLRSRFNKVIDSVEFFRIIRRIVDASDILDTYRFNQRRCIWKVDNVYINEKTGELKFIYLPVSNYISDSDIKELMEEIIKVVKPASDEVKNDIFSFSMYLEEMKVFKKNRIIQYLDSVDKENNDDNTGILPNSGFITDKRKEYYSHYSANNTDEGTELFEQEDDLEGTSLFGDDEQTGLLIENMNSKMPEEAELTFNNGTDSSHAVEDFSEDDDSQETTLLQETGNMRFDSNDEVIAARIHYPVLHRKSNNERIMVDKPVYRIGKEKRYVDYFVANNGAVSRSHADIVTRGNEYFIIDLNSKNKTFINGRVIPVHTEVRLEDGDDVKLGNEEFTFYF